MIRQSLIDKDCSIRNTFARQYLYLITSIKSFSLYRNHLNSLLSFFHELITKNFLLSESKYIFEQSAILFETILSPPKLKTLRFAANTVTTSSSTDLSSIDSTTFQIEDDDKDLTDDTNDKESYLIQFASNLCQYAYQFCLDHSDHSAFEHGLDFFTRLLNSSMMNSTEIVKKLTDSTGAIPEIFYRNYAKPLIKIAIEQHCALDDIVQITIHVLNSFNSSDEIVERVLADLIQVGQDDEFVSLFSSNSFSLNLLDDSISY